MYVEKHVGSLKQVSVFESMEDWKIVTIDHMVSLGYAL